MIPKRIPSKTSKADPGLQAQWLRTTFFQNFFNFVFVKFDCITLIYFNCSQHAMFSICILCSTLTAKQGMCEGASKQSPDPKYSS